MSVSLVNAGIASGQSLQKGAMAQRAYQQEMPGIPMSHNVPENTNAPTRESASISVFSAAPIGSQTGIEAYAAMMSPSISSSMRIEA